jgi:hypothetical protein
VHRRDRGGQIESSRIDALMLRIDDLQKDMERLEQQIGHSRRSGSPASEETATPASPGAV